jgi:hypothetical protein
MFTNNKGVGVDSRNPQIHQQCDFPVEKHRSSPSGNNADNVNSLHSIDDCFVLLQSLSSDIKALRKSVSAMTTRVSAHESNREEPIPHPRVLHRNDLEVSRTHVSTSNQFTTQTDSRGSNTVDSWESRMELLRKSYTDLERKDLCLLDSFSRRGIYLQDLSLANVLIFAKKVHELSRDSPYTTGVQELINPTVVAQLLSFGSRKGLNRYIWNRLTNSQVMSWIRDYCQPCSRLRFYSNLDDNVLFHWYSFDEVCADNFPKFHTALMQYLEHFTFVYHFLSANNLANSPNIDNNSLGIIRLFLSKLPTSYTDCIRFRIKDSYSSWGIFLFELRDIVATQLDTYQDCLKKSGFAHAQHNASTDTSLNAAFDSIFVKDRSPTDTSICSSTSNISVDTKADLISEKAYAKSKCGCDPNDPNCTCSEFDYDYDDIDVPEPDNTDNTNNTDNDENDANDNDDNATDSNLCILTGNVAQSVPGDTSHSTLQAYGHVVLSTDLNLNVCALFDTGSNSYNFVSHHFIAANIDALQPMLYSNNSIVNLGDSSYQMTSKQSVNLTLQFTGSMSHIHTVTDKFLVVPYSSHDVVIGLPTMTCMLFDFVVDLLKDYSSVPRSYVDCGQETVPDNGNVLVVDMPTKSSAFMPSVPGISKTTSESTLHTVPCRALAACNGPGLSPNWICYY